MRFAAFSAACLMLATPALAATGGDLGVRRAFPSKHRCAGSIRPRRSVETASAAPAQAPLPARARVGTGAGSLRHQLNRG